MLLLLLCGPVWGGTSPATKRGRAATCTSSFEGEVAQGQNYVHPGPAGLDFMLEWIRSGWIIRMLPHGMPRTAYDYAGLATPPYLSPNPILIATDFSFRAQDVVAWNPRSFQYFRDAKTMQNAISDYQTYMSVPVGHTTEHSQAAMMRLVTLASQSAPASLDILDATISEGRGNQTQSASLVATHGHTTPYRSDAVEAGPLGALRQLRFRVTFPQSCTVR